MIASIACRRSSTVKVEPSCLCPDDSPLTFISRNSSVSAIRRHSLLGGRAYVKASRTLLLPAEATPRRPRAAHQAAVSVPLPLLRGLLRVRSSVAFVSRRVRVDGVSILLGSSSVSAVSKREESSGTAFGARCVVIECCCMAGDGQVQGSSRRSKERNIRTESQRPNTANRLSRRMKSGLRRRPSQLPFKCFKIHRGGKSSKRG